MTDREKELENQVKSLEKKLHNLYNKRYRDRKKENEDLVLTELNKLGKGAVEILKAMTQASISNPLLGITTSLVFTDVLYRAGIIDIQTFTMIAVSVGVLEGTAITEDIITDVASFFKVFGGQNKTNDPITPTASTVVLSPDNKDIQALMKLLDKGGA